MGGLSDGVGVAVRVSEALAIGDDDSDGNEDALGGEDFDGTSTACGAAGDAVAVAVRTIRQKQQEQTYICAYEK